MNGEEATAFAARVTAAMGTAGPNVWEDDQQVADLASDLAGYLRALDGLERHFPVDAAYYTVCNCDNKTESCADARRYTDERDDRLARLTRTGALYGVTP